MPDEVFDSWFLPIIKDHNSWPYQNIFAGHPSRQWEQYFAFFSLKDIANCIWKSMTLFFDLSCLDPLSNSTIETLIQKHVNHIDITGNFNVRDSQNRFFGFVEFIKKSKSLPAPIIGLHTDEGLRVLDGNHRLAALTYLNLRGKIPCVTWVGAPKQSEK